MKSESIEDVIAEIFEAEMSEVRLEEAVEHIQECFEDYLDFELEVYYAEEYIPELHDSYFINANAYGE